MAVYTTVDTSELIDLLARYDVGELRGCKGIAEGVENSNFMLETTKGRYFLTLYEKRTDAGDLPFFIQLLDHVAAAGCRVPRMIADRGGTVVQQVAGRPACLIEFLTGVSVSEPSPAQCHAVGAALGRLHRAVTGFSMVRANSMGQTTWRPLAESCGDLNRIFDGQGDEIAAELDYLEAHWPLDLPAHVIHADLFPDNVLMVDNDVTGLIDFYFSCHDLRAFDVAVTHSAWCFSVDGATFYPERADALLAGYERENPLTEAERAALPTLMRGAAMRFILSRSYDWLNTPAGALVTRKDPLPYLRRLHHYQTKGAL